MKPLCLVAIFLAFSWGAVQPRAFAIDSGDSRLQMSKTGVKRLISKVTVRNADFEILRTIEGPESLSAFEAHWNGKSEIESGKWSNLSKQHLKLDIVAAEHSTRWLYEPDGRVRMLSKVLVPEFRITEPVKFNSLLIPASK